MFDTAPETPRAGPVEVHDRSYQNHKNTKLIRTYFNLCLTTLVVRNAYLYGNDLTLCGKIFDSSFI
jgi:hypothetical protein